MLIHIYREAAAEIMFETFNVPGLYIGVQAVLALYAALAANTGADSSWVRASQPCPHTAVHLPACAPCMRRA